MTRKASSPMTDRDSDRYPHVRASEFVYISYSPQKLMNKLMNLDVYEEIAYRRVMDMILISADTLEDDDKKLGYSTKLGKAKWLKIKEALINKDLLYVEDGRITSILCQEQLARVEIQISQKSKAGKASAKTRDETSKPLKNNNTASTAVGTAVPSAVGTNYELSKDDYYAQAREALHEVEKKPRSNGFDRPHAKPKDPNGVAIVKALTEVVIDVFGQEVGGDARKFTPSSDIDFAMAFLNRGGDLGLSPEETIETIKAHFHGKCVKRKHDGVSPPRTVSLFNDSGVEALVTLAKAKARATNGPSSSNNGRNASFAASTQTATMARPFWQEISTKFARSGRIAEARRIDAVAHEQGTDAANILARQMEAAALGNRRAA